MPLFHPDNCNRSADHARIFALYEIAYTAVDFVAAVFFVIGSVMFFFEAWITTGTWLFLIGSVFFALRPTVRLMREVKLLSLGDVEQVAQKLE